MDDNSLLHKAYNLVHGPRGEAYGSQSQDMGNLAKLWSIVLGHEITSEQATLCLILLKVNRLAHNLRKGRYHEDSLVDIAGYVEVLYLAHKSSPGTYTPIPDDFIDSG